MARHYSRTPSELAGRVPKHAFDSSIREARHGLASLTSRCAWSGGCWRTVVKRMQHAKQERIRLSERTIAGLERARRQGKTLGRPRANVSPNDIRKMRAQNQSWTAFAKTLGIARSTAQAYVNRPVGIGIAIFRGTEIAGLGLAFTCNATAITAKEKRTKAVPKVFIVEASLRATVCTENRTSKI